MDSKSVLKPKGPKRSQLRSEERLLFSRIDAAERLSISARAIDYLIANGSLGFKRIGTRVLIPAADLERFARANHPEKLAS